MVVSTVFRPVLTYESESWGINKHTEKQITGNRYKSMNGSRGKKK